MERVPACEVGALIVDSGKEGLPISGEDFEYLKVVGKR